MATRPISPALADAIRTARVASASFSPLAKAPLTDRYSAPKSDRLLTPKQRSSLLHLLRRAWAIHGQPDNIPFDAWRHEQCRIAAGVDGLRQARNHHYRAIKAHALALLGQDIQSLTTNLSTGPAFRQGETKEDVEQALWLLRQALAGRGLPEAYALTVARQRFRIQDLARLDAAQAMSLLIEVRRLYAPVPKGQPSKRRQSKPQR